MQSTHTSCVDNAASSSSVICGTIEQSVDTESSVKCVEEYSRHMLDEPGRLPLVERLQHSDD
jgi:hypothetical protein